MTGKELFSIKVMEKNHKAKYLSILTIQIIFKTSIHIEIARTEKKKPLS